MRKAYGPLRDQARTANDSYTLSANISKQQLRPYVLFDNGRVAFTDNTAFVTIVLKNTGQTPAYSMRRAFDSRIDDFDVPVGIGLQTKFRLGELGPESTDLGNGTPYPLSKSITLKAGDLDAIRHGTKAIYIWGQTQYVEDSTGPQRCFVEEFYARAEKTLKITGDWPLVSLWNTTSEIGCR